MCELADSSADGLELRRATERINRAWASLTGDALAQELQVCFHPDMIIRGPDLSLLAHGRDASVASYVDFVSAATIAQVDIETPGIDVWGDTALVSYTWRVKYRADGTDHDSDGRELLVFARDEGRWLVTGRVVMV